MRFFETLFGKKEQPIKSYKDFWAWFQRNERQFYAIMQSGQDPENGFFDKLSPKLEELKEGLFYLAGMFDKNTAELIITPDGVIKNIVFVEELVKAAPSLPNWKFTALKPENKEGGFVVNMAGYKFSSENLSFYAIDKVNYPDEVNIVIVHDDYNEEDKSTLTNGVYIFLDTYLGELYSITAIDNLSVIARKDATKELIPISKLKSYLTWREKEFVEKYNDVRYDTNDNMYSSFQAEHENGSPLVAIINTSLLEWDNKASHPWILDIEINYEGNSNNGMPDKAIYDLLNNFEEALLLELKDTDGYLNIGRQTGNDTREIYFACCEFRKASKIVHELSQKYSVQLNVEYSIYKDKYWQSYERFRVY